MAKNLKQLCAGVATAVVLSSAGAYFINKWLEEDSNKKKESKTEQVVKDMSAQGISVFKEGAEGAPDSVLTSVNKTHDMWTHSEIYSNPEYKEIGSKKPNTVRLGKEETKFVMSTEEQAERNAIKAKIDSLLSSTNEDNHTDNHKKIEELLRKEPKAHEQTTQNFEYEEFDRDFKNIEKDGFWSVTSKDAEAKHEQAIYNDGSKKIEFGYETYTFSSELPSDENMEQDKQLPKKPKAPKRTVSRDALPGRNLAQIKANKKQNG